jgi:integrase
LAAVLHEPARSITLLLVLTGLRIGELLALRWGSIDLNVLLLRVCEMVSMANCYFTNVHRQNSERFQNE